MNFNKKFSKFLLIMVFVVLFLSFCNFSFAGYVPPMTIDHSSSILEYFRSGDNYKFNWYQSTTNTAQDNLNLLTSLHANASELMNLWNIDITYAISQHSRLQHYFMSWDDISFLGCGRQGKYYIRAFFNSNGYSGDSSSSINAEFDTSQNNTQYNFGSHSTTKNIYFIDIIIDDSSITKGSISSSTYTNAWRADNLNNNYNAITVNGDNVALDYACALGNNVKVWYSGTKYTLVPGIFLPTSSGDNNGSGDNSLPVVIGTDTNYYNQSGELITSSSGESDLSNLLTPVDFDNQILESGDITSSLGFDMATDPYANFWTTLTNGLATAFSTSVRSLNISFQGITYTINLDDYTTKTPTALKVFLGTISTFFVLFGLFKYIKLTINKLSSGDVDLLLKQNQNEGITNLF